MSFCVVAMVSARFASINRWRHGPVRAPGGGRQRGGYPERHTNRNIVNLAAVCPYHHGLLIPHGDHVLDGNPNQPDGLSLRLVTAEERRQRRLEPMTVAV